MNHDTELKAVYTIVERKEARNIWIRIGIGFVNQDGSINVRLDAVPVNGRLHIRNFQKKEHQNDHWSRWQTDPAPEHQPDGLQNAGTTQHSF